MIEGLAGTESPEAVSAALLSDVDNHFRHVITGTLRAGALGPLFRVGGGNTHTLSRLCASTPDRLGFGVRIDAAQPLGLASRETSATLHYPDSHCHEHRFVSWAHRNSRRSGVLDVSYRRRWHFSAT